MEVYPNTKMTMVQYRMYYLVGRCSPIPPQQFTQEHNAIYT